MGASAERLLCSVRVTSPPAPQYLRSSDGLGLAVVHYPVETPRGRVLLVHGYGEHQGRYLEVSERLTAEGVSVWTVDLRGHGRSEGLQGDLRAIGDYIADVESARAHAEAHSGPGAPPFFLFGHSMGGLVCLCHVLEHPGCFAGLTLTSPFLAPAQRLPPGAVVIVRALARLAPRLRLWARIERDDVTRDEQKRKEHAADPLVFTGVRAAWAAATDRAQREIFARSHEVDLPLLLLLAGDDRVVDSGRAKALFDRLGSADKSLKEYPGLYHELLNEPERDQVLDDLVDWFEQRLSA